MKEIMIATNNAHKVEEFQKMLGDDVKVLSLKDLKEPVEIIEDGKTFEENALIKARAAVKAPGYTAIADDSGLCVEALGGTPGVYSARYAGVHGDDKKNRDLLCENLRGKADRTAYFCSAVVLCYPDGSYVSAEGRTYGTVLEKEEGTGGFGYDPVFKSDDLQKSFGLATPEEKNSVSHRFRALVALREKLGGSL
jgi:XTP/dITP diphosphohydrolase